LPKNLPGHLRGVTLLSRLQPWQNLSRANTATYFVMKKEFL
jgi:hypothetical protein